MTEDLEKHVARLREELAAPERDVNRTLLAADRALNELYRIRSGIWREAMRAKQGSAR